MATQNARADSLSLLLFTLRSGKLMAINLLKVSEIIPCPSLTKLPESHPHVKGVATLRGNSLSVIDLSRATVFPGRCRRFCFIFRFVAAAHAPSIVSR